MSRTQLFKFKKFVMTYAAVAVFIMCVAYVMVSAKAGTEMPTYITAEYSGNSVVVDGSIDKSKLRVCAVYEDGTILEVSDYTLSTEVVKKEGINTISVIYLGKTAKFEVTGKEVVDISPIYAGELISIDNAVDARNLSVYVSFSDESFEEVFDYTLENATVTAAGEQEVTVYYGGKSANFTVEGQERKKVVGLYVTYTGDSVMLGNKINRDEIFLTASYEDGSVESIINFDMSTETPTMLGTNVIVVSYDNKTTTFNLEGIPRTIESLTAEYIGSEVEVGKQVRKADIRVTARYSDGVVEEITDFDLPSPTIYFIGSHVKTVHYMGLTADIYVVGVEEAPTSYANAAIYYASSGIRTLTIAIALPNGVNSELVQFQTLKKIEISKALTREVKRNNFIVFTVDASKIDDELPLETKLTMPIGLNANACKLYYTPDRDTTIGLMEYDVTGENEITFLLYKSGTYILTYDGRLRRYLK